MSFRLLNQYKMHFNHYKVGIIVSLFIFISGCSSAPQTYQLLQSNHFLELKQYEISNVPFIAQQEYFCGPTTLA